VRDVAVECLFFPSCELVGVADRVVLVITERSALYEVRVARSRVADLRSMGFRVAIDDLGAGYAGLNSFATLEPEVVKLDMTLIRDIDTSPTKQRLVRSMAEVCEDMGMEVVAEGIETIEERATVVDLGCDLLQGYLFAKPGVAFPDIRWS
jgi:EAL domain-containing protein (putative c-di-GMP-specific phosphodiesterase class I)